MLDYGTTNERKYANSCGCMMNNVQLSSIQSSISSIHIAKQFMALADNYVQDENKPMTIYYKGNPISSQNSI